MKEEAPAAQQEDRRYQTFWRRVGAMILDGAVLAPLSWLDQFLFNHTAHASVLLPWVVVYSLSGPVYEVAFVRMYGQTLGKMACGVRVYDVTGTSVSLRQAMLRHIVPILLFGWLLLRLSPCSRTEGAEPFTTSLRERWSFVSVPGRRFVGGSRVFWF